MKYIGVCKTHLIELVRVTVKDCIFLYAFLPASNFCFCGAIMLVCKRQLF